jgi:hypothetical protein
MTDCVTNVLQREKVKGLRERKPFTLLSGPTWTRTRDHLIMSQVL